MMRRANHSLQGRLALAIGSVVALVWVFSAVITAAVIREEMNEVFDSALEETAQRILPLAVQELFSAEDDGTEQLITTLRPHDEFLTYVVRDRSGRVLLRSHDADVSVFPPFSKTGFARTETHVLYYDAALGGEYTIAVAEPLAHRDSAAREALMTLGLPLFFLLPMTLGGIWLLVRVTLSPLRKFRAQLAARNEHDLTPIGTGGLPDEIVPLARAVNALLKRLQRMLEAERSFAANAAHELRTPVAGALAQLQRLRTEVAADPARNRIAKIEASLKRLNRLSEKLMQMARAEGAKLLVETPHDLVQVTRLVIDEMAHADGDNRLVPELPDQPVLSRVDPDAFAIALRNLLENALRHGDPRQPVIVRLHRDGMLRVVNGGPAVPAGDLPSLVRRFARRDRSAEGSGLGLAIVQVIAEGTGGRLELRSPATGRRDGFEALLYPPRSPGGDDRSARSR